MKMDVKGESPAIGQGPSPLRQRAIIIAALVPVVLLLALLTWGVIRSGGNPGAFSVNSNFSEISLEKHRARDFVLSTFDGGEFRLSDTQGQVVMVDFWSSWCPPCIEEAPDLAQVYREYQGRGVEFVGVAIWDKADALEEHIDRFQITYPNALDDRGKVAIDYGVSGIPEKYFIDRQGNVIKKLSGPTSPEKLREILDDLVGT